MKNLIICVAAICIISVFSVFQSDINAMQRTQELVYEAANDAANTAALQIRLEYISTYGKGFADGYINFRTDRSDGTGPAGNIQALKALKEYLDLDTSSSIGMPYKSNKKTLPDEINIYIIYFHSSGSIEGYKNGARITNKTTRWTNGNRLDNQLGRILSVLGVPTTPAVRASLNKRTIDHPSVVVVLDCGKPLMHLNMLNKEDCRIFKVGLYEYYDF